MFHFFFNCDYFTHGHRDTETQIHTGHPENTVKIAPTRANPPPQLYTASQLPVPTRRKKGEETLTEDTSDSETLSRPRTPPSEPPNNEPPNNEPSNNSQTPLTTQPMATAKPMKPSEYDGKSRDARTVDAWLIRMITYLTLTNTADDKKVEFASSYLTGNTFD